MSASAPEAANDYSTGLRASRQRPERPSRVRGAVAAVALAAAILLVVSTFTTVIRITTGEAELTSLSGLEHHSIAMLLLGVAVVPMVLGAWRGARPAMVALAAIGAVVLLVALTVDLPAALDEGLYGERYENAHAEPALGFYLESLAGTLLVMCGGLLLMAGGTPSTRALTRRPAI